MFGIVIPAFRGGKYLEELIKSLINGSNHNWEAIIVDDSKSSQILNELSDMKLDSRFTVLRNDENRGPFASWNIGLEELLERNKYDLVAVVHEDDVLAMNYINNFVLYFSRYPKIDIYHSKVKLIGSNGRRKFTFQDVVKRLSFRQLSRKPIISYADKGLANILRKNFIFCPTMVFNVRSFDEIKFSNRWKMVGDLDFIANALLSGRTFLQLPDKNYFYRRHENNLTVKLTSTTTRFHEELQIYNELEEVCKTAGFNASAKVAGNARIIKLHIAYRIVISLVRFDLSGLRQLISVYPFKKN